MGELEGVIAEVEVSKAGIRVEAVDEFHRSQEYVNEVGSKAVSKIHDTYLVAGKYFKDRPDDGFDDFVD